MGLWEKLHQEAFLEEAAHALALDLQLICENRWLTALQEGQASKDMLSDSVPLLVTSLASARSLLACLPCGLVRRMARQPCSYFLLVQELRERAC